DICTWSLPHAYDFISAWDSIWHVPLAQQEAVLRKLMAGLAPGGVLLFTAGGLEAPHEITNPCHGQPLYHATLGIPAILRIMGEAACAVMHLEYDQHPANHVCIIGQRQAASAHGGGRMNAASASTKPVSHRQVCLGCAQ